jgi:hypothetical protein
MDSLKDFFVFNPAKGKIISAQCKLCGKTYSDNIGSTGNFHKHLKRVHTAEYNKSKVSESTGLKNDTNDSSEDSTNNSIKINQAILEELIVKCNLPPSIVEYVGFRNFLKIVAPKWKPASSRYFTKTLLPTLMKNTQHKIKDLLSDVNHLTITVDAWTDKRGRSFIGVTGHFLDSHCIPKALLLDFSRLKGPHTGENIYNITEQILNNLEVSDP